MNKLLYIAGGAALGMLVLVNKGLTSWDDIKEAFGLSANGGTSGGGSSSAGSGTMGGTNGSPRTGTGTGQTGTEQPPTERGCENPPCEDMTTNSTINGYHAYNI